MSNKKTGYKMILAKSYLEWIKVGVLGILFSLVCISVGIWLLVSNNLPENTGVIFYKVFSIKPLASILTFGSFIFLYLYIVIGNKNSLQTLLNLVWNNKLSEFVIPKIHQYIQALTEKQPDWMKNITGSRFCAMCLDVIRQDSSLNKVQRLVLNYGFKNIKLKKSDFDDFEYQLPHVVVSKIESKIESATKPSYLFFLILFSVQLVILILALVLN